MYTEYIPTLQKPLKESSFKSQIYNNYKHLRNLNTMTIDLAVYAVNRLPVKKCVERYKDKDLHMHLSLFSCTTHTPIIVVAFYAGEVLDYPPEIVKMITNLIKDYNYKSILNQLDGSPFLHLDKTRDIKL